MSAAGIITGIFDVAFDPAVHAHHLCGGWLHPRKYWTTIGIGATITDTAADNENNFRFAGCRDVPSSEGRIPAIGELNIAKVSRLQ